MGAGRLRFLLYGGAKCFVAVPTDAPARVLGFYTLSRASLEYARTPAVAKKGFGRYDAPVFRLGRLAVDKTVQDRGLGGALILRAADRSIRVSQDVGGVALLIDAKTDRAVRWCEGYGLRLDDAPLSLAVAADALRREAEALGLDRLATGRKPALTALRTPKTIELSIRSVRCQLRPSPASFRPSAPKPRRNSQIRRWPARPRTSFARHWKA